MAITVQFATNRRLTGPGTRVGEYGNGIVTPSAAEEVWYGTAFVDQVDLTADTVGAVTWLGDLRQGGWSAEATGDLVQAGRNLLVFIHGFDNSFENAITRAAFNREWLAGSGLAAADTSVVAFSWPSQGRLLGVPLLAGPYLSDQVMARQSAVHLMGFLARLEPIAVAARRQGRRVFLLVHSMGHYALQAAVEAWFAHGNGDAALFDEAILAAGDEQYTSFEQPGLARLSGLSRLARRVTVLFSEADQVLGVSQRINFMPRLGQDGPRHRQDGALFPAERYGMVDCTGFQDFTPGFGASHQYYRRSPGVRRVVAGVMGRG